MVAINGYYREELLSKQLLPAIRSIAGDLYVFHQDNAPAHRARQTVELLQYFAARFQTSLDLTCGHRTIQILILSTTASGV